MSTAGTDHTNILTCDIYGMIHICTAGKDEIKE